MDCHKKAVRGDDSHDFVSPPITRKIEVQVYILPSDLARLTKKISNPQQRLTLSIAELEEAADRLIDLFPQCPPRISRLLDRITDAIDQAKEER